MALGTVEQECYGCDETGTVSKDAKKISSNYSNKMTYACLKKSKTSFSKKVRRMSEILHTILGSMQLTYSEIIPRCEIITTLLIQIELEGWVGTILQPDFTVFRVRL